MKNYLSLILFLVSSFACAQTGTVVTDSIFTGGEYRSFRVYIPNIYSASNAVPLVFNFHGYGSNNVQQELYGDFRSISDTANFILVHPQGIYTNGNAGWSNFGTVAQATDDLNFIADLIDTLSAQYSINQDRVYSTGMSNGGFMSYDLACFLSDRFAAIASVTGSMTALHKNSCTPQHPVPVMQIHGTADQVVSYSGTTGIVSSMHIDSLVKHWIQFNSCNLTPVFTVVPNISTSDGCTAEHYLYAGGTSGSTVEFYKIIGGGHTWPGSAYPSFNGYTNQDINAGKEIWRFFRQYDKSQLTGVKEEQQEGTNVSIYPNPSDGAFRIEIENANNAGLKIFNALGEVILMQSMINSSSIILDHPPGIYLFQVSDHTGILKSGKLVIQ